MKLFLVCLICLLGIQNYIFSHVSEQINSIPEEDRKILESLFYSLFNRDHFAYTLFGDKPISLAKTSALTPWENILCGCKAEGALYFQWEIWKKHQTIFAIKNYLLIEDLTTKSNDKTIVLINKRCFVDTVNKHLMTFKEYLGSQITAQRLLDQIEAEHKFIATIKDHEILWGILLGYGAHNAAMYHRRKELSPFFQEKNSWEQFNFECAFQLPPTPERHFDSTEEEWRFLNNKLQVCGDYGFSLLFIQSPHFVADLEHKETHVLINNYKVQREKISEIYAKGDFLEITLSQLSSF